MIFVSSLLLSEGVSGAEERYAEVVLDMPFNTSRHEIVRMFMQEKGFLDGHDAVEYTQEHILAELVPLAERGGAVGWGKVRLIEVAERGQGQQRWLMVVRDAYDDERAWEFKPTT